MFQMVAEEQQHDSPYGTGNTFPDMPTAIIIVTETGPAGGDIKECHISDHP